MNNHTRLRWVVYILIILFSAVSCTQKVNLKQAQKMWQEQGIKNYQLEVRHVSSIWHLQTIQLEIVDGRINHSAACIPAPVEGRECEVESYDPEDYTVDGLFKSARWLLDSEYTEWGKVEYDPVYGFPTLITYDHPDILDEDSVISVLKFAAIE